MKKKDGIQFNADLYKKIVKVSKHHKSGTYKIFFTLNGDGTISLSSHAESVHAFHFEDKLSKETLDRWNIVLTMLLGAVQVLEKEFKQSEQKK